MMHSFSRFHITLAGFLLIGLGSVVAACTRDAFAEPPPTASPETLNDSLRAEAIPLDLEKPSNIEVGKLTYMGGLSLKSSDSRFGGLSSLHISDDGFQMLAVSDRGYWVGTSLSYKGNQLTGAYGLKIAPLLDLAGNPLNAQKNFDAADAEAITEIPGSGFAVAFEGNHRIWHYGVGFNDFMLNKLPNPLPLPVEIAEQIKKLPHNGGLESLTTLPDGRLVAIAEDGPNDGFVPGWIIGETSIATFSYEATDKFRPTDMATLSNGDILVLERRLTLLQGLSARIKRIPAADIKDGAVAQGEEIATLNYPYNIDNMEGISVRETEQGTFIYIVSDDNYLALQRTLLMVFRLEQ